MAISGKRPERTDNDAAKYISNLNRRDLLKLFGTGGMIGIAGCGSGTSDQNNTEESLYGGNLRLGVVSSFDTLHPFFYKTPEAYYISNWLYSNLTMADSNFNVQPDLAKEWESNDELDQWTFDLREDATFHHNGNQVLAEDVKATIEKMYSPDVGSAGNGQLGPIDNVEVVNDTTVQFNLKEPSADLPKLTTLRWGRIIPKNIIENKFEQVSTEDFGSGPFTLEKLDIGNEVVVSRYDDYYLTDDGGNDLPYLSNITMKFHPEASTRVNSLLEQNTDVIDRLPVSQYNRVDGEDGPRPLEVTGGWFYPLVMDTTVEPFNDKNVRHAIKYALDYNAIMEGARQGRGTVAKNNPVSPAHQFYADLPNKFGAEAMPEKAEDMLSQAGHEGGLTINHPIRVASDFDPPMGPSAILVQEQLGQVGIETEIQQITWETYINEVETNAELYLGVYGFFITEDTLFNLLMTEGGTFYGTNWHESEPDAYNQFTDYVMRAAGTTDNEKRSEFYKEAQKIVQENAGIVVPFFKTTLVAENEYVQNYGLDPAGFKIALEDVSLTSEAPE